jgi:hypothetical protein
MELRAVFPDPRLLTPAPLYLYMRFYRICFYRIRQVDSTTIFGHGFARDPHDRARGEPTERVRLRPRDSQRIGAESAVGHEPAQP